MIITITGDLGSGKSTVAHMLAQRLGYGFFSTGDAFRQLGEQRGLSVMELSQLAKTDRSIDDYLDGILRGFDRDNYVIDSRMAWHFILQSYKIYLKTDAATAAGRIICADRTSESTRRRKRPKRRSPSARRWRKRATTDCTASTRIRTKDSNRAFDCFARGS